jgi:hypothetical protein
MDAVEGDAFTCPEDPETPIAKKESADKFPKNF